jgi:hypothetical protein
MQQEIDSITKNQTWEIADRPVDKIPITGNGSIKLNEAH